MAVDWTAPERTEVEDGLARFPISSGRCAALARVVHGVGSKRDKTTKGRQITPKSAARFVVPKCDVPPKWWSHTYVDTHQHSVDALTGVNGCPRDDYLETHWTYCECLRVADVDVSSVDTGIQEAT